MDCKEGLRDCGPRPTLDAPQCTTDAWYGCPKNVTTIPCTDPSNCNVIIMTESYFRDDNAIKGYQYVQNLPVIKSDGSPMEYCYLPPPESYLRSSVQNGLQVCGGYEERYNPPYIGDDIYQQCYTFDASSSEWKLTHNLTGQYRAYAASWKTTEGTYLIGGNCVFKNGTWDRSCMSTTVLLKNDGTSVRGFQLERDYSRPCTIQFPDYVILVDGKTVAKYNSAGFVENMPNLSEYKNHETCSKYLNDAGKNVSIF